MSKTIEVSIQTNPRIEKVKINLPYYSKSSIFAYKIIDKDKQIQVCNAISFSEITLSTTGNFQLAFENKCVPCTEEEFNTMYAETLVKITQALTCE